MHKKNKKALQRIAEEYDLVLPHETNKSAQADAMALQLYMKHLYVGEENKKLVKKLSEQTVKRDKNKK